MNNISRHYHRGFIVLIPLLMGSVFIVLYAFIVGYKIDSLRYLMQAHTLYRQHQFDVYSQKQLDALYRTYDPEY